jgi:hypothetical protein
MSMEINNKIINNEVLQQSKQELRDHKEKQQLLKFDKRYYFSKLIKRRFIFICVLNINYFKLFLL